MLIESSSYGPQNIVLVFVKTLIVETNHRGSRIFDLFSLQHTSKMGNGKQCNVTYPFFHFVTFLLEMPDWRHCTRIILSVRET